MKNLFAVVLCILALPSAQAINEPELLEPDLAFALTVRAKDANTLEASWKIAKGYYLYRDKFKFESLDPALTLEPAAIPPGKKKEDPTFGVVETFTNRVTVTLPIERRSDIRTAKLRIGSQGCNEPIGVCYPPVTKEITVALPPMMVAAAGSPATAPAGGIKSLKDLSSLFEPGAKQEFLHPDQAFVLTTETAGTNAITARIRIASDYYLYRDKTHVKLLRGEGVQLGTTEINRGKIKDDPYIGKTEVLYNELVARVSVIRASSAAADLELEIGYQGCAEGGICYPPTTKKISLRLPPADSNATAISSPVSPASAAPVVRGNGIWTYVLAAFGIGLLLTFTPCVLPMIPILSGVIVRSGDQTLGKLQGGLLSYSYVLGTAITYTAAGVLAGASGDQLQAYFQNPWAIGTFAVILAFLALSMFGLYELQMPSFIQSRLHYHTHKIKGGSYIGAFVLGLVSALIIGACVSPVLMSALGVAISTKDPVLGGAIMFSMAHGMGVVLILVGVGAGFLLPKAGAWMDRVKYVFGVMLIGVAIFLLGYLPEVPVLLLWSVLLIVTAVYLGATQTLPPDASGWRTLWKGFGTFLLLWGVLSLFGGLLGERDILKPLPLDRLASITAGGPAVAAPAGEKMFQSHTELRGIENELARAKREGKPVILDFYASWCTDCVRMEKTTFNDARVRAAMQRFVLLKADVTDNNEASLAIKKRFGVFGPPAMVFYAENGEEKQDLRFYGYRNAEEFLALLAKI